MEEEAGRDFQESIVLTWDMRDRIIELNGYYRNASLGGVNNDEEGWFIQKVPATIAHHKYRVRFVSKDAAVMFHLKYA